MKPFCLWNTAAGMAGASCMGTPCRSSVPSSPRCSTPSSPIRPMLRAAGSPRRKTAPPTRNTAAWTRRTPCRILTGITGTREAGRDGCRNGFLTPGKPAGRERRSACSSTGGSTLPSPTLSNGPDGSGVVRWFGIR